MIRTTIISIVFGSLFVGIGSKSLAQIPSGYYDPVQGLYGDTLRFELSKIIAGHNAQSYASLWNHFWNTDRKPDSTVWDMYSDNPIGPQPYIYQFYVNQCGNYAGEGDCYNREHSFPKSWFGDQSPMNTDLFHLFPTDGYVNGQRGNFPYGETNNPSWTSMNGSKKGNSATPGYSGTVFEPIDEYKGDFARAYFYMLTRYYNQIGAWSSDMLSNGDFSGWAKDAMLQWAKNDTVSAKEISRNEAIYLIQQNRNPFVDHPDFAKLVWGDSVIIGLTNNLESLPRIFFHDGHVVVDQIGSNQNYTLKVIDLRGVEHFDGSFAGPINQFTPLPSGIFLVQVIGNEFVASKKICTIP